MFGVRLWSVASPGEPAGSIIHFAARFQQGLFKVVEINHPLVLSLSKDGCRWFDKLTMSGGRRTLAWVDNAALQQSGVAESGHYAFGKEVERTGSHV